MGMGTGGCSLSVAKLSTVSVVDGTTICSSRVSTATNGAERGDTGNGISAGRTSGLGGSGVAIAAAGISTTFDVALGWTALPFDRIVKGFVGPLVAARRSFSSSAAFMRAS
jgi:hypothetical protein